MGAKCKKIFSYLAILLLITVASCKQELATLRMQVYPTWAGSSFALNTTYATPDGKYLNFNVNKLFLSHIKLIKNDNSTVEVSTAAFIDFASNSNVINLAAPVGDYKGIEFGIGLDTAQNHIDPAATPSDPIFGATPGMWWDASPGVPARYHLFADIEGYSGTTASLGGTFFYHVGTDSFYRSAMVSKSFSISNGQNTALLLQADFQKLFYGTTTAVNVIDEPYTHSTDAVATAKRIADGSTQLFSLQ